MQNEYESRHNPGSDPIGQVHQTSSQEVITIMIIIINTDSGSNTNSVSVSLVIVVSRSTHGQTVLARKDPSVSSVKQHVELMGRPWSNGGDEGLCLGSFFR